MSYIQRAIEPVLLRRLKTAKCVAVVGARQVGKTTVVRHLFPKMQRINMMNQGLLVQAMENPLLFLQSFPRPLFIDEVQEAPGLLSSAKVILDEAEGKGNFVFSGSQKWELMGRIGDSLAGMVSIVEVPTLSMREIHGVDFADPFVPTEEYLEKRKAHLKGYATNLWETIHGGFYPEQHDEMPREWDEFYADYVKTYLERDVYKIIEIRDSVAFYRFLVAVASRTGNIVNFANIANDVGIDLKTAQSWMGILVKTNIVYLLKPYHSSHLNRAIKSEKVYFRDTGLAAYLCGWLTPETLRNGANAGAFFETFVVNEIIKSYANAGKEYDARLFYYRGRDKRKDNGVSEETEIDLIIEENNILYPIEIKKKESPIASDASAFPVLDKELSKRRGMGVIFCLGGHAVKLRDNLIALPINYI